MSIRGLDRSYHLFPSFYRRAASNLPRWPTSFA